MPPFEFLLICAIKRVLITHMGLVTIVEEAPATIEEQKLTTFGLSRHVLDNVSVESKRDDHTVVPKKKFLRLPIHCKPNSPRW